jgi:hypothetical protein
MKKNLILAATLLSVGQVFSQNGGVNPLNSKLDPMESRGYIKWEKNPDEVYRVRVLRKDTNNNFIELEQVETKNAHLSIRNYLEAASTYYVVEAINTATSMQVGVSDTIPILLPAGHNPWVETCRYRCNGKTYAYQLGLYQQEWNPATNTWSITDPAKFIAKETYDYFNASQGITIPFYQAIDAVVWNQISSQHPYKVVYGGNPKYKKITILNKKYEKFSPNKKENF